MCVCVCDCVYAWMREYVSDKRDGLHTVESLEEENLEKNSAQKEGASSLSGPGE